jgi:hypothetical protein
MTEIQFESCVNNIISIYESNQDIDDCNNEVGVALYTMEIFISNLDIVSVLAYIVENYNIGKSAHNSLINFMNDYKFSLKYDR